MKLRFLFVAISALLLAASASDSRLTERQRALHALSRLGFGARPGDVDRVLKIGVDNWIDQQLHPEAISDRAVETRLQQYPTLRMSDAELIEKYYRPIVEARREKDSIDQATMQMLRKNAQEVMTGLVGQRILRAAESERQLNEVMVDFWMNHFNVFAGKGIDRFLLTSYERDTIRPRVWGHFEDLLMATAKSPAMLFYLDNARSAAAPENRRDRPIMRPEMRRGGLNENYARELMELHTLGVDGGYTQKDVTELARVLTGWSIARPQEGGGFVFRKGMHDIGAKIVLGVRFPSGGGIEEGERMIHILAHHPSTAHHIAYKLAQRLVADDPPKALVDRVAKRFVDTDGDLRQTVKAVIDSPEFWDPRSYRAKVKAPFEYAISAVRAIDGQIIDPTPLARELQKIGEPLYGAQPPTGYSDKAEAWVNTGALLNRLNFALALAANKMPGVRSDVPPATDVDTLAQALTGGALTDETRKTIRRQAGEQTEPATIVGLILGSPEFQKQ
jgi:uncharacterized protein (DUF1800 family)